MTKFFLPLLATCSLFAWDCSFVDKPTSSKPDEYCVRATTVVAYQQVSKPEVQTLLAKVPEHEGINLLDKHTRECYQTCMKAIK